MAATAAAEAGEAAEAAAALLVLVSTTFRFLEPNGSAEILSLSVTALDTSRVRPVLIYCDILQSTFYVCSGDTIDATGRLIFLGSVFLPMALAGWGSQFAPC